MIYVDEELYGNFFRIELFKLRLVLILWPVTHYTSPV
jgi:hypothetical protein